MSESVLYHCWWSPYRDLLPEENLSKYFYTYEYSNVSIGAVLEKQIFLKIVAKTQVCLVQKAKCTTQK